LRRERTKQFYGLRRRRLPPTSLLGEDEVLVGPSVPEIPPFPRFRRIQCDGLTVGGPRPS